VEDLERASRLAADGEMHVTIDQARHDRHAGDVDGLAGEAGELARGPHGGDASLLHQHAPPGEQRDVAVENQSAAEQRLHSSSPARFR
jgi:hypothetical protein